MIIKILFSSALTLHRPWPPILISVLFHPGLFFKFLAVPFLPSGCFWIRYELLEKNQLIVLMVKSSTMWQPDTEKSLSKTLSITDYICTVLWLSSFIIILCPKNKIGGFKATPLLR